MVRKKNRHNDLLSRGYVLVGDQYIKSYMFDKIKYRKTKQNK